LPKRREPYTFFVDRSFGGKVVIGALRAAGISAVLLDDIFPKDTPDEIWLARAGQECWPVLSKDTNIRRNELERNALLNSDVAAFLLRSGDMAGPDMGQLFVTMMPLIRRVVSENDVPFVATVLKCHEIHLLWASDKNRLPMPKRYRLRGSEQ
jgi:hypothetical protein